MRSFASVCGSLEALNRGWLRFYFAGGYLTRRRLEHLGGGEVAALRGDSGSVRALSGGAGFLRRAAWASKNHLLKDRRHSG